MLSGGMTGALFGGMGGAFGLVHLQITEENLARAARILEAMDEDHEADDELEDSTAITEEPGGQRRRRKRPPIDASPDLPLRAGFASSGIQRGDRPTAKPSRSGPGETGIAPTPMPSSPMLDAGNEPQLSYGPDEMANRAWRAAVIGLLFFPPVLHFYSLVLLSSLGAMAQQPSPAGMRKVYGALAIDLAVFAGIALLLALIVLVL
jgi:hypothetical protein